MRSAGRSLELFFIEGDPEGMLTAEVFNWTGHVLYTPRTRIKEALTRTEAGFTGVYLLLGELDGELRAYVGEAEDIAKRIRQHDVGKDWWTTATLITTAANNLNKAHVRYLETRLIERAIDVGRVPLDNATTPSRPSLTESAQANMEAFLEYLWMVLPALRIDMFVSRRRSESKTTKGTPDEFQTPAVFELQLKKNGIYATAVLSAGEFVVQAGSDARSDWIGAVTTGYANLHAELVRSGVLQANGDKRIFSENYAFRSTSAAAAIVTGRQAAGPDSWIVQGTAETYKQWEKRELSRDEEDAA